MPDKNAIRLIPLILLFFLVVSCGTPNIGGPPPQTTELGKDEFVIGPADVLQINVWKQPNISATVPVRSDGKISIPLVNDIQASGLTPHELKHEIENVLENYIEAPTVSVIVEAINSQKITVTGGVNAPGTYQISGRISLVEAMSLVGGISPYGNGEKIRILRVEDGEEKIYQVNYIAVLEGKDFKQNVPILPGDTIIVPE